MELHISLQTQQKSHAALTTKMPNQMRRALKVATRIFDVDTVRLSRNQGNWENAQQAPHANPSSTNKNGVRQQGERERTKRWKQSQLSGNARDAPNEQNKRQPAFRAGILRQNFLDALRLELSVVRRCHVSSRLEASDAKTHLLLSSSERTSKTRLQNGDHGKKKKKMINTDQERARSRGVASRSQTVRENITILFEKDTLHDGRSRAL